MSVVSLAAYIESLKVLSEAIYYFHSDYHEDLLSVLLMHSVTICPEKGCSPGQFVKGRADAVIPWDGICSSFLVYR